MSGRQRTAVNSTFVTPCTPDHFRVVNTRCFPKHYKCVCGGTASMMTATVIFMEEDSMILSVTHTDLDVTVILKTAIGLFLVTTEPRILPWLAKQTFFLTSSYKDVPLKDRHIVRNYKWLSASATMTQMIRLSKQ
ncbi:uncharacterized protein LOC118763708 [Octopus sinensis]|uniref:Uncharacterized protein LOC118763708 n=1 Tax=Octopus sinensis TaxID=2607531 RepID=A0A7E6EX95_9MOLL|nr:uncharacterized protein LOC118763708 [Octopus sinensis]